MVLKFLNDVIKPWDDLNKNLIIPYAVEPETSNFTRLASALAISIKHQPEKSDLSEPRTGKEKKAYLILSDLADSEKHGVLRKSKRQCNISIASAFEYKENKFSFLRNIIFINHASFGEVDFIEESLRIIKYWVKEYEGKISWNEKIKFSSQNFQDKASLIYSSEHCLSMSKTRVIILKRNHKGLLEPFAPPEVRLFIY